MNQDEVGGHKASSAIDVLDRMSVFAPEVGQMVGRYILPGYDAGRPRWNSTAIRRGLVVVPIILLTDSDLRRRVSYNMNGARVIQWVTQSDNPLPPGA